MIDKKVFSGGINTDLDERLLQPGDYRYALNIRNISGAENEVGALQNIKGNTAVTISLPSGTNKVVGTTSDVDGNSIYFFGWNSANNHWIYQYNTITGVAKELIQSQYLEFIKHNPVVANVIEDFLFFTDGFHEPKRINIKRAINNEYDSITSTQPLEVIQYPPTSAPQVAYVNNSKLKTNLIKNTFFQFCYRYYYIDGEISTWSPISESMINTHLMDLDLSEKDQLNAIDITINTGTSFVEKIEIAVRTSPTRDFDSEIVLDKERLSISENSTYVYQFKNTRIRTLLDRNDLDRFYDDVPKSARAQGVTIDNRIVYGDVTQGFNNMKPEYSVIPDYHSDTSLSTNSSSTYGVTSFVGGSSSVSQLNGSALTSSTFYDEIRQKATVVLSGIPSNVPSGSKFELDVSIDFSTDVDFDNDNISEDNYGYYADKNYQIQVSNESGSTVTRSAFLDDIVEAFNNVQGTGQGSGGSVQVSAQKSLDNIEFRFDHIAANSLELKGNPTHSVTFNLIQIYTNRVFGSTFKGGSEYSFGVVYFDRANRASYVQLGDNESVYFKQINERPFNKRGRAFADWYLYNTPPEWATHYQWVYAPRASSANFQYMIVDQAQTPTDTNDTTSLYLDVSSWKNTIDEYTQSGLDFSWITRGNIVRVHMFEGQATHSNSNAFTYTSQPIEFEVLEYHIEDSTNDKVTTATSGTWIKVEPLHSVAGFTRADFSKLDHAVIEVYTPEREDPDVQVFYEMGERYDVGNPHASNRYHKGDSQDQGTSESVLLFDSNVSYFDVDGQLRINYDSSSTSVKNSLNALSVGDVVKFLTTSNALVQYALVVQTSSSYNFIQFDVSYDSSIHNTSTILSGKKVTPAVGKFENGDIYFRERKFTIISDNGATSGVHSEYVEDRYQSDKYGIDTRNIGRAHTNNDFLNQERRKNTLVWSDTYDKDSTFNGLSTFFNSNFLTIRESAGAITHMTVLSDAMYVFQENGISMIPMKRQMLTSGSGGTLVALSQDVLGEPTYLQDVVGLQHPSLFLNVDSMPYFVDLRRKSVFRLKGRSAEPVSALGLRNLFNDKLSTYEKFLSAISIVLGYDYQHGEVVVSFNPLTRASEESVMKVTLPSPDPAHTLVFKDFLVETDSGEAGWTIPMRYISGQGQTTAYNLDEVCSKGYIDINHEIVYGKSTAYYSVKVDTNQSGDLDLAKTNTISKGTIQNFSETSPGNVRTYTVNTDSITGETLAFNIGSNAWTSYYSFLPEYFADSNGVFLSFKDGAPWKHNTNSTYNSFYGTTYSTKIDPVFNGVQSQVSFYKYLRLDGNSKWDISYSTDYNSGSISKSASCVGGSGSDRLTCELNGGVFVSDYREIEGYFYADFRRDGSDQIEGERPKGYNIKLQMTNDATTRLDLFSVSVDSDVISPVEK